MDFCNFGVLISDTQRLSTWHRYQCLPMTILWKPPQKESAKESTSNLEESNKAAEQKCEIIDEEPKAKRSRLNNDSTAKTENDDAKEVSDDPVVPQKVETAPAPRNEGTAENNVTKEVSDDPVVTEKVDTAP